MRRCPFFMMSQQHWTFIFPITIWRYYTKYDNLPLFVFRNALVIFDQKVFLVQLQRQLQQKVPLIVIGIANFLSVSSVNPSYPKSLSTFVFNTRMVSTAFFGLVIVIIQPLLFVCLQSWFRNCFRIHCLL